jgi:hypothetical protein
MSSSNYTQALAPVMLGTTKSLTSALSWHSFCLGSVLTAKQTSSGAVNIFLGVSEDVYNRNIPELGDWFLVVNLSRQKVQTVECALRFSEQAEFKTFEDDIL